MIDGRGNGENLAQMSFAELIKHILDKSYGVPHGHTWTNVAQAMDEREKEWEGPSYRSLYAMANEGHVPRSGRSDSALKSLQDVLLKNEGQLGEVLVKELDRAFQAQTQAHRLLSHIVGSDCIDIIIAGHVYLDVEVSGVDFSQLLRQITFQVESIDMQAGGKIVQFSKALCGMLGAGPKSRIGSISIVTVLPKGDKESASALRALSKRAFLNADLINIEASDYSGQASMSVMLKRKDLSQTVLTSASRQAVIPVSEFTKIINDIPLSRRTALYLTMKGAEDLEPLIGQEFGSRGPLFFDLGRHQPDGMSNLRRATIEKLLKLSCPGLAITSFWALLSALEPHSAISEKKKYEQAYRLKILKTLVGRNKQINMPIVVRDAAYSYKDRNLDSKYVGPIVFLIIDGEVINLSEDRSEGIESKKLVVPDGYTQTESCFDADLIRSLLETVQAERTWNTKELIKRIIQESMDRTFF